MCSVKLLVRKCYDQRQNVSICFIDYQRAFDKVKNGLMLLRLLEIVVDENIHIIKQVYLEPIRRRTNK